MNKAVANVLKKRQDGEKGFTLIELLVVVIIIGILAAVAIPIFLNMREGAWKASVESDVANAVLAVEQATTAANGSLTNIASDTETGPASLTLGTATATISKGNTIAFTNNGDQTYTIVGTNVDLGTGADKTYTYNSATGTGAWG